MLLIVLRHGVGKNFVRGPFASVTGRSPALPPPLECCTATRRRPSRPAAAVQASGGGQRPVVNSHHSHVARTAARCCPVVTIAMRAQRYAIVTIAMLPEPLRDCLAAGLSARGFARAHAPVVI